ncbi:facilitated trehalose transporter Tret1-like [Diorhabda sublineata]|uniref:facilitated trehalose transporter Tret1-like n=1 Tax=Diorhabda sublineata TaxID=1163346 RepID=UPI0024E11434|nr:facilitated trehalose transporter Tret1-like [Diorhabda sublineata]
MIDIRKYVCLFIILTINLLATTGDITLSWSSPVFPKLYSEDTSINPLGKPITIEEESIVGSILNLGALIGPIPFNFVTQKYGYKKTLLCLAIPHIISFLILSFAKNIFLYYLARFLAGLSLGAGYSLFATYVGDISDDSNRGGMVVITNIFWSMGNFIPLAIGPFTSILSFNLILTCIPVIFLILFSIIGVESPYYLVRNKKEEEAVNVLVYLRGKNDVEEEMTKVKNFVENSTNDKISDLLTDTVLRKCLIICCFLLATQDLGGYCSILYHLELIFESAGSNISEDKAALIVGVGLFLSSFIAPFLVDHFGRRPLLIASCLGMSISLALLGLFFYLQSRNFDLNSIRYLPLFSLISYIVSYNFGINTVPWSLISELFPSKNKQTASSIGAFCCWFITASVTFCYNYLNDLFGIFGTFWVFSGWCLVSTIFCFVFVPETKGKSFLEVQQMIYKHPE